MDLSVLFWNIWSDGQLDERGLDRLRVRLGEIIDEHEPDVLGLNEVVVDEASGVAPILDYLESRGYETRFAPHGPERSGVLVGSALASKWGMAAVRQPVWGADNTAARHGFPGHLVRAIDADISIGDGQQVRIIVNYWAHLVPYNWWSHRQHVRAFQEHLATSGQDGHMIIGGDFNEFKHMPAIRALGSVYNRATGTFREPTWRWHGQRRRLIRANYDNILWTRTPSLEMRKFSLLPSGPSDHTPLLGQFFIVND